MPSHYYHSLSPLSPVTSLSPLPSYRELCVFIEAHQTSTYRETISHPSLPHLLLCLPPLISTCNKYSLYNVTVGQLWLDSSIVYGITADRYSSTIWDRHLSHLILPFILLYDLFHAPQRQEGRRKRKKADAIASPHTRRTAAIPIFLSMPFICTCECKEGAHCMRGGGRVALPTRRRNSLGNDMISFLVHRYHLWLHRHSRSTGTHRSTDASPVSRPAMDGTGTRSCGFAPLATYWTAAASRRRQLISNLLQPYILFTPLLRDLKAWQRKGYIMRHGMTTSSHL